jgi:Ca2+-binding RTX toxin-like protein
VGIKGREELVVQPAARGSILIGGTTMRRTVALLATLAVLLVLGSGVALAALVEGDDQNNTLTGTPKADTIRGFGGDDTIHGRGGPDTIYGDSGNDALYGDDTLYGGKGEDLVYGGPGDDTLYVIDLYYTDTVDCGPGHDRVVADFQDDQIVNGDYQPLKRCEQKAVGGP